jgi:methylated-DNA-[protein]-cysteine S-methyltransferase
MGGMTGLAFASLSTPAGPLSVGCSAIGVARVHFGRPRDSAAAATAGAAATARGAAAATGSAGPRKGSADHARSDPQGQAGSAGTAGSGGIAADRLLEARRQLAEYLCGRRKTFDLPLDWSAVSGPQRQVLGVLLESVGYGQTVTYGALARRAGLPDDGPDLPARVVGQIMGSNPIPVIVPCHRVVASDGLGGYSGGTGLEVKRWLLILEGALPPTLDWEPALPGG